MVYISVSAVTAAGGFALTASPFFQTPKRNQKALPLHSVPRLGSACHNEGIAPGARRHRPSMAGGGYRGILAAVPPAQYLRSASGKGAGRSRSKATATATATARSTASRASPLPQLDWVHPGKIGRLTGAIAAMRRPDKPAPTKKSEHIQNQSISALLFHHSTGRALARLQLLMLTHRPLERPRGGSAQWATRHGCRVSRPRPWMADGGGPTEQDRSEGMPSLGEAPNERGKSALVTLALFPK